MKIIIIFIKSRLKIKHIYSVLIILFNSTYVKADDSRMPIELIIPNNAVIFYQCTPIEEGGGAALLYVNWYYGQILLSNIDQINNTLLKVELKIKGIDFIEKNSQLWLTDSYACISVNESPSCKNQISFERRLKLALPNSRLISGVYGNFCTKLLRFKIDK